MMVERYKICWHDAQITDDPTIADVVKVEDYDRLASALELIATGARGIGGIGYTLSRENMQRIAREALRAK